MRHHTHLRRTLRVVSRSFTGQVVLLIPAGLPSAPLEARPFQRGDANTDGSVDISDSVFRLSYLFAEEEAPSRGDANDVGRVDSR